MKVFCFTLFFLSFLIPNALLVAAAASCQEEHAPADGATTPDVLHTCFICYETTQDHTTLCTPRPTRK